MLLGGEAFTTPRHVWWNFVSSSRDRINEAKADWKARKFPLVPGDSEEFIPIPDVPNTVSYPRRRVSAGSAPGTYQHVRIERSRDAHQIGRAHVCTPVTNAHLVFRLLHEIKILTLTITHKRNPLHSLQSSQHTS